MPNPDLFQKLWSSIPGRVAQGALVDPVLGTLQTGAHLVRGTDRLLGHPEWGDPGPGMDAIVNGVNSALEHARSATGQNADGEDYWRDLGTLLSPLNFVAPELDGAILGENAGRLARMGISAAHDAANAAISSPVDTRSQPYLTGKAINTAIGAAGGAIKSGVKGGLDGLRSTVGQIVPDFVPGDPAMDISPEPETRLSLPSPESLPRLTAPDFIPLPPPDGGPAVPLLEYQPDPSPVAASQPAGLIGGQYAAEAGDGAASVTPDDDFDPYDWLIA